MARPSAAPVMRLAMAGALLLALGLAACQQAVGPQRVEIRIHYSTFEPSQLSVPHGVPITFVLINEDPIDHEWLVGDDAFHERHRTGSETHHGTRPTEVSIPALATVETTITFDAPGRLAYICHLPRHEEYGMRGVLLIT